MEKIEDKPYAIDLIEEIEKERVRLKNITEVENYKHIPDWIQDWLTKTNEELYEENDNYCSVCGKKSRYYIKMDFSCEEYPCNILLCKDCLIEMLNTLENKIEGWKRWNGVHFIQKK